MACCIKPDVILITTHRLAPARLCLVSLPGATGSRAARSDRTLGGRGCRGRRQAQVVERFGHARDGLRMTHVFGFWLDIWPASSLCPINAHVGFYSHHSRDIGSNVVRFCWFKILALPETLLLSCVCASFEPAFQRLYPLYGGGLGCALWASSCSRNRFFVGVC